MFAYSSNNRIFAQTGTFSDELNKNDMYTNYFLNVILLLKIKHRSRCFGVMRDHDLFFLTLGTCLISITKVPYMRTYQNVVEFPAMSKYSILLQSSKTNSNALTLFITSNLEKPNSTDILPYLLPN
jgi:hypothetical protein